MAEYEIPLVIFTVLSQWAVGIIIAIVLLEWLKPKYMNTVGKQVLKSSVYLALSLSVVAALASMLHLNNPLKGPTSLLGLGHSWLSREIVAVILFNACLLGLTYLWWKKTDQDKLRRNIGTITALLGVILVISSAIVYFSIQLHPTWNNWTTFASFLLTGLLLGALTVALFVFKGKQEDLDIGVKKLLSVYLSIIIVALFITVGNSAMISNGASESQIATTISYTSILFWIRIIGSMLLPATLVIYMIVSKKSAATKFILAATTFALIGELSGRAVFYYSVMSQYPWF
ncbi:dimethyl sulfoxide reductase anchor subunit [Virgibacillus sp. NKC19-3]|uniref:dimethyl sulfoxide reductase anchor subunit family protein n=1 Tax=Virgibacillus saliphilus TaxID=2831674 RepID=UPI001C9B83F1|nr:DmsC/YnfH family molybdoenzyme membrane anchor subunit [Virgibacillus sp. NKC19-3]MBY7142054.1 dimethyl sulfoxide reductase anchor subunit [Virgibacillus sp. NKC19-3]